MTIAGDTLEKLRLAREMLRHAAPAGDEAVIIDRALTSLLTDLARKKFAATDRPREPRGSKPGSRDVPGEVKRAVWVRGFVEFHHVRPYEVGGEATIENIQLRCGSHNRYEAKVYLNRDASRGEGFVSEAGPRYDAVAQAVQANSF